MFSSEDIRNVMSAVIHQSSDVSAIRNDSKNRHSTLNTQLTLPEISKDLKNQKAGILESWQQSTEKSCHLPASCRI